MCPQPTTRILSFEAMRSEQGKRPVSREEKNCGAAGRVRPAFARAAAGFRDAVRRGQGASLAARVSSEASWSITSLAMLNARSNCTAASDARAPAAVCASRNRAMRPFKSSA